jgi:hypothetical protein
MLHLELLEWPVMLVVAVLADINPSRCAVLYMAH